MGKREFRIAIYSEECGRGTIFASDLPHKEPGERLAVFRKRFPTLEPGEHIIGITTKGRRIDFVVERRHFNGQFTVVEPWALD